MSGLTAIGYQNIVKAAALSAGSAASGLGASNVANDRGASSVAWQTADGVMTEAAGAVLTITPTVAGQTLRAAGLFRTNLTASASIDISWSGASSGSGSISGPVAGYGQCIYVLPADATVSVITISINDSTNPDNHINVPLVYAGPLFIPAIGHSFRSQFGRQDRTDVTISLGGQEYAQPRWSQRYVNLDFDALSSAELFSAAYEIDRIARLGGNVLAIPSRTATTLYQEAVFGRMATNGAIGYPAQASSLLAWNAKVTERL